MDRINTKYAEITELHIVWSERCWPTPTTVALTTLLELSCYVKLYWPLQADGRKFSITTNVLWYRFTWLVPEKGPLKVCVCVCAILINLIFVQIDTKNITIGAENVNLCGKICDMHTLLKYTTNVVTCEICCSHGNVASIFTRRHSKCWYV